MKAEAEVDELISRIDDAIFDEREPGCSDSLKDPALRINEVGWRRLRDILLPVLRSKK